MPRNQPQPQSPPPPEAPSTSEPIPAELEQLAAEAEGLGESPPAPAAEAAEPAVPTADLLVKLYGPAFTILAPNWGVSPAEVKLLADTHGPVIDKYWPGGPAQLGVELAAALATLAVLGPRWNMPRVKPPAPKPDAPPATPSAI